MVEQVDVVVLGMGVGGEEIAGRLAEAGLSVAGVEGRLVGGECPYWGCVPSKMMIRAANLVAEARRIPGIAGTVHVTPEWAPVAHRIRTAATDNWTDAAAVDRFVGKGGQFIRGWGRLHGPNLVRVDARQLHARVGVVVATGGRAVVPPIPGLADTPLWTNKQAIEAADLPESLIVLGGGAIGLELAQVFARFGVSVTVVEAQDRLLAMEEPESSTLARAALEADGVTVRTSTRAEHVAYQNDLFRVTVDSGPPATGHRLLVAVGRRADLTGLGLDTVGIDPAGSSVPVDDRMRAGHQLWAVGDVTGRGAFTHVAMYQAGIAIRDILGKDGPAADYRALPRVTFTDPEIGSVGLSEAQAHQAGLNVHIGMAKVAATARGWIHNAGNEGFIKLVVDAGHGLLVGATAAGPVGGEVLGMLTLAVHARVPVHSLRSMIYAYPTFHRGVEDALRDLHASAVPGG